MEFAHESHRQAFERVEEYLGELFEEVYHDHDNGHFYVSYGSTVLEISVDHYGPEDAIVMVMSYCVQGASVDKELLKTLLEINHGLPVGAFSVVGDDIFFAHSLFGKTIERHNLLGAIAAVANIADDYDDQLAAQWGGQRALDRIRDTGGRKRRREGLGFSMEN